MRFYGTCVIWYHPSSGVYILQINMVGGGGEGMAAGEKQRKLRVLGKKKKKWKGEKKKRLKTAKNGLLTHF